MVPKEGWSVVEAVVGATVEAGGVVIVPMVFDDGSRVPGCFVGVMTTGSKDGGAVAVTSLEGGVMDASVGTVGGDGDPPPLPVLLLKRTTAMVAATAITTVITMQVVAQIMCSRSTICGESAVVIGDVVDGASSAERRKFLLLLMLLSLVAVVPAVTGVTAVAVSRVGGGGGTGDGASLSSSTGTAYTLGAK